MAAVILPVQQATFQPITKAVVSKTEYTRIPQQSGGSGMTISTSATESIFELPSRVFNLSKSHLKYKIVVPDPGTTPNFNYLWVHEGGIRQIQLYTRSGTMLVDLNNLQQYLSIVTGAETKKADAVFLDSSAANLHVLKHNECTGSARVVDNLRPIAGAQTAPDGNPYERQYLFQGADEVANTVFVDIDLSLIKNTLFEMNKSVFFNESILMKVIWAERDSWGFKTASGTNPGTGAGAFTGDIVMSDLYLYLALERNPLVASAVIDKTLSEGIVMNCPYVYSFKHVPGGAAQNVTLRINRSNGSHLKKIYHSLFNATETFATRFKHDRVITSYSTSLNNQRLQQFDLKAIDDTDFMYHYDEILKDSMVSTRDSYRFNWFHCDKLEDADVDDPNSNVTSGVPLDVEQKWDINITCPAGNYNHYSFAITNRPLVISAAGIVFA